MLKEHCAKVPCGVQSSLVGLGNFPEELTSVRKTEGQAAGVNLGVRVGLGKKFQAEEEIAIAKALRPDGM